MKNFISFLFLLLSIHTISAQYTAIPDPVFENYLENNGMGDGIPDNGLVLTANINTVTTVNLPSFAGLTDLTGIEDFVALEFLDFSYNTVSSIDLSQNTALSLFGCAFNNLTSLDLSNNTNLTWVVCMGNYITSLVLNSPYLHTIECFENQLTSLDLSQCPALDWLDCHSNQLTSLNINQCVILTDLIAWGNQLASLDTSQNIELSYFNIGHNNITGLDISNNIQLTRLGCINNDLTSLILTENINLESFIGHSNSQLISLDIRNGNNSAINYFDCTLSNLDCIFVDDASASYLDNWLIDANTTFVNNEEECEALSVSAFNQNLVKLYPNPATDFIVISTKTKTDYKLFNINGKIIKEGVFLKGLNSINISNLLSGIYLMRLQTEEGVITKRILKI